MSLQIQTRLSFDEAICISFDYMNGLQIRDRISPATSYTGLNFEMNTPNSVIRLANPFPKFQLLHLLNADLLGISVCLNISKYFLFYGSIEFMIKILFQTYIEKIIPAKILNSLNFYKNFFLWWKNFSYFLTLAQWLFEK